MPNAPANHGSKPRARQHEARPNFRQRGYTSRWDKLRKLHLQRHPLCVHCESEGKLTPATEVDHVIPHRGDQSLFWNEGNWQSLCKSHHSAKTAREVNARR